MKRVLSSKVSLGQIPLLFYLETHEQSKVVCGFRRCGEKKLGLPGEDSVRVLVVKCDPILLGSLLGTKGFLPAYHMSKANWVSICMDDTPSMKVDQNFICFGCQEKGDVIDFTAKLFGLSPYDAAGKLIADMGLTVTNDDI